MKKKVKKILKKKRPAAKKKAAKKAKKPAAKAKTKVRARAKRAVKPIGKVLHFYNHIGVAIVRFSVRMKAGTKLQFKGATTDFVDVPKSMQFNHAVIAVAPKGKQVGVKVKKRVREGDLVYIPE